MCLYWSLECLCGHYTLLAGGNCYLIYEQLQRINNPAEFAASQQNNRIPFEMPPQCLPHAGNVQRRAVNRYCSYECMNNGIYAAGRCGARDARYGPGSERVGVGWRY